MLRHNTAEVMGVPSSINNVPHVNGGLGIASSNINSVSTGGSPLDALPKQFLVSMKTLFDILDDQRTGFVKLVDIEKGWQDDGCKGLPRGVIDSLRKVTPASGLLSFERFCAGLKLCLLRNQNESKVNTTNGISSMKMKSPLKSPAARPPSAPLLDINPLANVTTWSSSNPTATVRPHNISAAAPPPPPAQRALSMPQLSPDSELDAELTAVEATVYNSPPPPPKPPRSSMLASGVNSNTQVPLDKTEIRHALQNWQMGVLLNEMDAKDKRKSAYVFNNQFYYRGCADGGSSSTTDSVNGGAISMAMPAKKSSSKRREPRRHTLQNGIDYNMLKRLKQFEEEREVLLLGLDAVEKARDWYIQQVANVQEKIKYLGRMGHVEQWSEVQQERLNFQRARVFEVNRNLSALADSWERGGFPLHFNLAIRSPSKRLNSVNPTAGGLLQAADRHLHLKGGDERERITALEHEKQLLLREIYDMQQRMGLSSARSTGFVNMLSQSSPACSSSSGVLGDADVVY